MLIERVNCYFFKVKFKKLILLYVLVIVCFKVGDYDGECVRTPQQSYCGEKCMINKEKMLGVIYVMTMTMMPLVIECR